MRLSGDVASHPGPRPNRAPPADAAAVPDAPAAPVAVVADGDAALRQRIGATLAGAGWRVHEAADGLGTLELVRALQPAVVVLAAELAELDGLAVCWAIGHDPLLAATRLVLTTVDAQLVERRHELGAGAHAYLLKPFDGAALAGVLARLWG
ncbi:MAG: response regulator [Chloroflexi bacterium]|nr:response regulator [Chloroflexota bacterium]